MKKGQTEALAARRRALRAELQRRVDAARSAAVARRAKVPKKVSPREQERRRRRWLWLLLLLLLLLLCMRCGCVPPPPPGVAVEVPAAPAPVAAPVAPDPPPARIARRGVGTAGYRTTELQIAQSGTDHRVNDIGGGIHALGRRP